MEGQRVSNAEEKREMDGIGERDSYEFLDLRVAGEGDLVALEF